MRKSHLAGTALLVASAALTACLDEPTGVQCAPMTTTVVQTIAGPPDTIVTSSGLRYIELSEADSGQTARWCFQAQVQYSLSLEDGTFIEEGPIPNPPSLPSWTPGFGQVIPGFEQGVVGMTVGSTRRLIVPPSLAYGAITNHPYQNATLVFDVDLIAVE